MSEPLMIGIYFLAGILLLLGIVLFCAGWMAREADDRRFQHLLKVAADLDSHDPLERLFERESYQR